MMSYLEKQLTLLRGLQEGEEGLQVVFVNEGNISGSDSSAASHMSSDLQDMDVR